MRRLGQLIIHSAQSPYLMSFGKIINFFLVGFLAACTSIPDTQGFLPTAQQQGSLRWQMPHGERLNAAITFFEDADGRMGLSLGKEGPQPLLQLVIDGEQVISSGPLIGGNWSGPRRMMPKKLSAWVALLDAYSASQLLLTGKHHFDARTYVADANKSKTGVRALTVYSRNNDIFFIRLGSKTKMASR